MGKRADVFVLPDRVVFVRKSTGESHTIMRAATPGSVYAIGRLSGGRTLWGCRSCNWTHENAGEPVEHACGSQKITRLGDRVKSALQEHGITEASWEAFKREYGLPPGCNCERRRAWLNRLDEKLGLGEKLAAIQAAMNWRAKDGHDERPATGR